MPLRWRRPGTLNGTTQCVCSLDSSFLKSGTLDLSHWGTQTHHVACSNRQEQPHQLTRAETDSGQLTAARAPHGYAQQHPGEDGASGITTNFRR
jgi:hypothetical protein